MKKHLLLKILLVVLFVPFMYWKVSSAPWSSDFGKPPADAWYMHVGEKAELMVSEEEPVEFEAVDFAVTVSAAADPDSPAGRAAERNLPAPPEIDINSWEYILANGEHSIQKYAPPSTVTIEGQIVDSRIAEPLKAMAEDSRAQGLSVYLSSGYRSYDEQAANFTRICQNNGVSDGKNRNGFYITKPAGCSGHQTGLCCDITDVYYSTKTSEALEKTDLYQYMSKHCHEFGFIVRFPDGDQQTITGVMYEPWHYRYVGVEAATYIMENHLTLEEFIDLYIPGTVVA